jgi:thiosulfate/3-mercaptopyruvate sulfurtransferase
MELLVSTQWLADHLDDPDLVVLDCTVHLRMGTDGFEAISGREDWAAGHIPGAGFADLTGALCDGDSPLRFALPEPEVFAAAMADLGVGEGRRVVLYDANASMWAARVWWMLRWIGFDDGALLDGGWTAWSQEARPVDTTVRSHEPSALAVRLRPRLVADKDEVAAAIGDGATCIVDALTPQMYSGEIAMYRRGGHIPGAVNAPASALTDPDTGRFRPVEELAAMFDHDPATRTITYCGGGIAASGDAFALTLLGYDDVAVYTASMQEWASDPDAPLVTEPTP